MPLLQEIAERYGNDLVVLGINFDEPEALVQSFVDDFGITFPILLDPGGQIGDLYRVYAFPTTIIVDEAGVIQVVHIGQLFAEDLDRYMAQLKVGQ
jgi:peroxiredoxin